MGRELQKRKNRSSVPKVRHKPKSKKKVISNPIIAAHWNNRETLEQNYRRLGLASNLNQSSGGAEKSVTTADLRNNTKPPKSDPLTIGKATGAAAALAEEAQVQRDPVTGAILRVLEDANARTKPNPLNDPLNELDDSDPDVLDLSVPSVPPTSVEDQLSREVGHHGLRVSGGKGRTSDADDIDNPRDEETEVIREIRTQASRGVRAPPRKPSSRESDWIERLVGAYGDDYTRMSRDIKLNPMQQSVGDIRKRVKRWKDAGGAG